MHDQLKTASWSRQRYLALVFAVCILAFGGGSTLAEKVTIEFWHPYTDPAYVGRMEAAAESFMKLYPNIEVIVTVTPGLDDKLKVAVAAGVGPDVAHVTNVSKIYEFSDGVFEPLNTYLAEIPEWNPDDVFPGFLDAVTLDGTIWALPLGAQPTSLVWNPETFGRVGLAPISGAIDDETFRAYSDRLTEFGPNGELLKAGYTMELWSYYFNFAYHWGGDFFDEATNRVTAVTPANLAAMDWLVDLYDYLGGTEAVNQFRTQFPSNEAAIIRGYQGLSIWPHYRYYSAYSLDPGFEPAFAPPPQMGDPAWTGKGMITHTDMHAVIRGTKHPKEAALFALYTTLLDGFIDSWTATTAHPSASISLNKRAIEEHLVPEWYPYDLWMQNLQVLSSARPWPKTPIVRDLYDTVTKFYVEAVEKKISSQGALENVERTMQALIDSAQQ